MGRWSSEYENNLAINSIDKFVKEAELHNCWINVGKKWYTPQEFSSVAYKSKASAGSEYTSFDLADLKIRDPRPLIAKMDKHILETMEKLVTAKVEFEKKVKDYYEKK